MTYPIVHEKPSALQAVSHDTFIDDLRARPGAPRPFTGGLAAPIAHHAPTATSEPQDSNP